MTVRAWNPEIRYTANGWFAEVWVEGALGPYWRKSCLTRWGAKRAAHRMTRKLRRLDTMGLLESKKIA